MSHSSKSNDSFEFTLVSTGEPTTVVVDEDELNEALSVDSTEQVVMNTDEHEEEHEKRLIRASGIGSAVLGCFVGGPILAIVLGVGAKFACEQPNSSFIRDIARAVGEVALLMHLKAKELNERHSIVDESQRAVTDFWHRAKEADEKHHILEKTKQGIVTGYHATADYVQRHNLIERFMVGAATAVVWLGDKVNLLMADSNNTRSNSSESGPYRETQRVHLLRRQDDHEIRVTE